MTQSLEQAQAKLNELLDAAKKGAIIPIRLPAQIEEIAALLTQAEEEAKTAQPSAAASGAPTDMESYIKREAYFVGHAVHEIKNPLTPVKGYVDMLMGMGGMNEMQQQFMNVIKTNVKRMEAVLNDVGIVNKLEKKTIKVNPKMDMFKNIGLRVEKDMTPLAKELNRQLTFDIPSGLPLLNVDGDLLTTALNKLVENALRYTPAETGQVTVSAAAEGSTLVITVSDNGIGITPEDMAHLGEIYFRSEHDVVREFKGSGLGIPIVYGLVRDVFGGTVEVTSEVDKGTTFTIKLPGMT